MAVQLCAACDNTIKYRKMDGITYTGYSNVPGFTTSAFPAVASAGSSGGNYITIFARGTNTTEVAVTRTSNANDGTAYLPWQNLGGILLGAPTAAYLPSTALTYLFINNNDPNNRGIFSRYSSDGYNFSGWFKLNALPGGLLPTTAPVATVVKDSSGNRVISLFVKASDNKLYVTYSTNGTNSGTYTAWSLYTDLTLVGPSDNLDFALAQDVGAIMYTTNYWAYQTAALQRMRPSLVKFQMFTAGVITQPQFNTGHLDTILNQNPSIKTVILRTDETNITASQVSLQVTQNLNAGTSLPPLSIMDYIASRPNIDFWIQVGNEPDCAGQNAADWRDKLLDVIRNVAPTYRPGSSVPRANLRWMASLSYICQGTAYVDTIIDNNSELRQSYDAFGVHVYSYDDNQPPYADTLFQQYPIGNSNGAPQATVVLDRVLAKTTLPVFIVEAGIHRSSATLPWSTKAGLYVDSLYRMPSQVRGTSFFALTQDPAFYGYGIDVNNNGTIDTGGSTRIGNR